MAKYGKKYVISVIALALAALSGGTSFAIVKDTLSSIKPFALMAIRFTLATVVLLVVFAKRLRKVRGKDIKNNLIVGFFLFSAFFTLVIGISYTTASKQAFLVGAYVLVVPFLSWAVNKRKPDVYAVIGVVLATAGIGMLTLNKSLDINKGDILSIMCALFFACHMVAIEYLNKDSDPIAASTIQLGVTSAIFLILAFVFEPHHIDFSPGLVKALAYLVFVTTIFTFVVQNIAQKFIPSTSTALIFTLETAFGGLFAVYFLDEKMTMQMKIGCMIIFAAILIEETKLKFFKCADIEAAD